MPHACAALTQCGKEKGRWEKVMELISQAIAQEIVETVHEVCKQNINFINEQGVIIASTDLSRVGSFHEVAYQAVRERRTIEVTDDDSFMGSKKGINIPILYNNLCVAVIGISGEAAEVRKYAYLAQRITEILLKERELDAQGVQRKNRQHYVIRCLVNREVLDERYLRETLKENGLSADAICRVVLVGLNARYNPDNLFMIQSAVTQTFRQMGAGFYRYNYPNEYILIMESRCLTAGALKLLEQLATAHREVLSIGIGPENGILESDRSYQCARAALACASPERNLVQYDTLDFDLLLHAVPGTFRTQYSEKILKSLDEQDRKILRSYFEHDMSLQATSQALFIHKNSLQYRLNHIAAESGYNPRKFRDAVVLYSALKAAETI